MSEELTGKAYGDEIMRRIQEAREKYEAMSPEDREAYDRKRRGLRERMRDEAETSHAMREAEKGKEKGND